MINKSKLWFLTLTSIILVLVLYYALVPTENIKEVFSENNNEDVKASIEEASEAITAMKIDQEENYSNELKTIQESLLNTAKTSDEKNELYEEIKYINNKKVLEEKLTNLIDTEFKTSSFVNIEDDKLKIVIDNKESSYNLANNIISFVNKNVKDKYYITVKFE